MKSLDRQSLDEQTRLVSRYVAGDLSRSERSEFEAWLIASPELAADVEMERRMRRGIASAARRGWLKRPAPGKIARERGVRIAIAASLLTALAVGWSLFLPPADRAQTVASTPAPAKRIPTVATRTVQLGVARGFSDQEADIEVSRANAPGELVIEPEVVVMMCVDGTISLECSSGAAASVPQYPEYEADLVDRTRATLLWRSPRQVPISRNQVSFTVKDPGALRNGDYDFLVRGHSADHEEVVARFTLRITN